MVLHKKLPTSKDSNPFKSATKPIFSKPEAMVAICSFCNKTFSDIDALQEHLPTHNDINNLENITERRQEPGQTDQDNLFLCNKCPCKFSTATDLRIHLFFHSGKTPTCEVCNRTFRRQKGLTSHMMVHEKIRNFKCNICEMEFPRNYILKRHIVLSHAGEPLKCDECNSAFRHPERLAKHKRLAHPRRDDMKCVKCSEQFTSLKDLSIHKLIHLKENPVICDTASAKKKDLTRHEATYHGKGSKELYKCSTCQRTFKRLNNLILHKKLHGDNKTHAKLRCEHCNKIFTKEAHLRLHTPRCQENMRLQLCHVCGQFYSNKTLNHHLNSHSDMNSYICETCKEILPNQTSLKIHVFATPRHFNSQL